MSFSLMVSSTFAVTKAESAKEVLALRSLDGANWVEITPAERKSAIVAHLSFHRDMAPRDVKRLFSQLVPWAKSRGYSIVDPQSGEAIDLDDPPDISLQFVPHAYRSAPSLMGKPGDWEIVVGDRGVVGHLRESANGDIRLVFGDDEATSVPTAWLLEKIAAMRRG
jgi:hypothetical protein